jgi:hypothetical protein
MGSTKPYTANIQILYTTQHTGNREAKKSGRKEKSTTKKVNGKSASHK